MSDKLTLKEVCEKYGEVPLKFYSYYKYVFTFSGVAPDGCIVYASVGGHSDDIYRMDVDSDTIKYLGTEGHAELFCSITICKDRETIFDYDSY